MIAIDKIEVAEKFANKLKNLRVLSVNIIVFSYQNRIRLTNPILEMMLENKMIIGLNKMNGGENIGYYTGSWKTALDYDESVATADGELIRLEISTLSPFEKLVGQIVTETIPLYSQFEEIAGLNIIFSKGDMLSFLASADENYLFLNDYEQVKSWGFHPNA
jgi:hypothetical protein